MTGLACLIGDVVSSRESASRARLHEVVVQTLERVNDDCAPVVPLRLTVGDEFQGCFATVGQACAASAQIRLALLPDSDARFGIGWGTATVLQEQPRIEDGPGWWAAREAIELAKAQAGKAVTRSSRTAYRRSEPDGDQSNGAAANPAGPEPAAVNAALLGLDQLMAGLSAESVMLLRGLIAGDNQRAWAETAGVSESAASQRVRRDGLGVIKKIYELLADM